VELSKPKWSYLCQTLKNLLKLRGYTPSSSEWFANLNKNFKKFENMHAITEKSLLIKNVLGKKKKMLHSCWTLNPSRHL
jgi:hypothetical protein